MGFDFAEAFVAGVAETGGTFEKIGPNQAWIGPEGRRLSIWWASNVDRFRAYAGAPERPDLDFSCVVCGWEEWQAKDAGRAFAERAYEIAGRLPPSA